jgi:hypothetical protein
MTVRRRPDSQRRLLSQARMRGVGRLERPCPSLGITTPAICTAPLSQGSGKAARMNDARNPRVLERLLAMRVFSILLRRGTVLCLISLR